MAFRLKDAGGSGLGFGINLGRLSLHRAVVQHIGNRVRAVGTDPQRGGMVRQHQHPEVLPGILHGLLDGSDDPAVQVLDGQDLVVQLALMTHFIGGFHMDVGKIATIWEEFCTDYEIAFRALPPAKGGTKLNPDYFKALTGWKKRTSEHARDAAMIVFGR